LSSYQVDEVCFVDRPLKEDVLPFAFLLVQQVPAATFIVPWSFHVLIPKSLLTPLLPELFLSYLTCPPFAAV